MSLISIVSFNCYRNCSLADQYLCSYGYHSEKYSIQFIVIVTIIWILNAFGLQFLNQLMLSSKKQTIKFINLKNKIMNLKESLGITYSPWYRS
jgi:hypothetical protein